MNKTVAHVALESFLDLAITILYATLAGLLIVVVVASDDAPPSLLATVLWVSLLPFSVTALIGSEVLMRVLTERRRRRPEVQSTAS